MGSGCADLLHAGLDPRKRIGRLRPSLARGLPLPGSFREPRTKKWWSQCLSIQLNAGDLHRMEGDLRKRTTRDTYIIHFVPWSRPAPHLLCVEVLVTCNTYCIYRYSYPSKVKTYPINISQVGGSAGCRLRNAHWPDSCWTLGRHARKAHHLSCDSRCVCVALVVCENLPRAWHWGFGRRGCRP